MQITLKVWRQADASSSGSFVSYNVENITEDMSFFEVLDMLNDTLVCKKEDPIAFDHDCREGICGTCGVFIDGRAHGPLRGVTSCQIHMRSFKDGQEIILEPWRASGFPVIKDLVVNRSAFDRIMESGGYVSMNTGGAIEANAIPIAKLDADEAFDAAACIGCGACVATCKTLLRCFLLEQKYPNMPYFLKANPKLKSAFSRWSQLWMRKVLEAAQIPVPARLNAQKKYL